ncbi:MAG TPA: hypothetical protein VJS20_03540 [Gemmatimonadales bacterium]|nr:hypothetical protein [Gemmatimonadales bacterium]
MTLTRGVALACAVLTALPLMQVQAQENDSGTQAPVHGKAFFPGNGAGWTVGYPSVDVNAGYYTAVHKFFTPDHHLFLRVHTSMNTGIPHFALSADINWLPSVSANPAISFLGQIDPLSRESAFYLSGGGGLITAHNGNSFAGWVQLVLAYRTHIHELAPFVQVGHALTTGQRVELLVGVAHPLAPYLFHVP